jgi:hypothetical protein
MRPHTHAPSHVTEDHFALLRVTEPPSPNHAAAAAASNNANASVASAVANPVGSPYPAGGTTTFTPSMSRLEAVIRVLRSTKKVMHYDALTKQALRMGLIRFSGSQGTAGESMKAFLNKIIRGRSLRAHVQCAHQC